MDLLKGDLSSQETYMLVSSNIAGLLKGDINADQAVAAMGRCKSLAQTCARKEED